MLCFSAVAEEALKVKQIGSMEVLKCHEVPLGFERVLGPKCRTGLKKSIEVHWDHEFQKGPECF